MARIFRRQKNFADLELERQNVVLDEDLQSISDFLDHEPRLVEMVQEDLERGVTNPRKGRRGMNAEQLLRSLILQRIKNLPFRELRDRIEDSYTWRNFTRFYSDKVPKHAAFHRDIRKLRAETMLRVNETVIRATIELGIEDGSRLRVDTTASESDIHYPTDGSLLVDAVRRLTRLVQQVGQIIPELTVGFSNRTRRAKRRMREIDRRGSSSHQERLRKKYQELMRITAEVVAKAREVAEKTEQITDLDPIEFALLQGLREQIREYARRADRVIDQTRRRVVFGEKVAAQEKIYSIFEPHTDLIKRGKVRKPLEFGHKVFFAETHRGLITEYQVLKGNPSDTDLVVGSLERHRELFGRVPELYAADRGFHSAKTVESIRKAGVKQECVPQKGGQRTAQREAYEKSRKFRKGQRFRSGIEGRISVLHRGRGTKRCPWSGREGFEVYVGAAVLANNLLAIARLLKKRGAPRLRAA